MSMIFKSCSVIAVEEAISKECVMESPSAEVVPEEVSNGVRKVTIEELCKFRGGARPE